MDISPNYTFGDTGGGMGIVMNPISGLLSESPEFKKNLEKSIKEIMKKRIEENPEYKKNLEKLTIMYNEFIKKQYPHHEKALELLKKLYEENQKLKYSFTHNGTYTCHLNNRQNLWCLVQALQIGTNNMEIYNVLEKTIELTGGYLSGWILDGVKYGKATAKHTEYLIEAIKKRNEEVEKNGEQEDKIDCNRLALILMFGETESLDETIQCTHIYLYSITKPTLTIKKIGDGGTKKVYKMINLIDHKNYVLKIQKKLEDITNECAKEILTIKTIDQLWNTEITLLKEFDHENISKIHDAGKINECGYIVEEYFDGIDLEKLILKSGNIKNTREFALIFSPMFSALNYLEIKGYVHRDIKPNNILLTEDLKKIVLTDLQNTARLNVDGDYWGLSYGSRRTAAYEILSENRASPLSDRCSLGHCMYFALTGEMLFDKKETNSEIRNKRYLEACVKLDTIKNELKEDDISKKIFLTSTNICEMVKSLISDNEDQRIRIKGDPYLMAGTIELMSQYYNKIKAKEEL